MKTTRIVLILTSIALSASDGSSINSVEVIDPTAAEALAASDFTWARTTSASTLNGIIHWEVLTPDREGGFTKNNLFRAEGVWFRIENRDLSGIAWPWAVESVFDGESAFMVYALHLPTTNSVRIVAPGDPVPGEPGKHFTAVGPVKLVAGRAVFNASWSGSQSGIFCWNGHQISRVVYPAHPITLATQQTVQVIDGLEYNPPEGIPFEHHSVVGSWDGTVLLWPVVIDPGFLDFYTLSEVDLGGERLEVRILDLALGAQGPALYALPVPVSSPSAVYGLSVSRLE